MCVFFFLIVAVLVLACQAVTSCKSNIAVVANCINSNNNNSNNAQCEADWEELTEGSQASRREPEETGRAEELAMRRRNKAAGKLQARTRSRRALAKRKKGYDEKQSGSCVGGK